MTKWQITIFLFGILVTIAAAGVSVAILVGLEQAFQAALTAALVYVTATYVYLTSKVVSASKQQTEIARNQQINSAAPVISLSSYRDTIPGTKDFGAIGVYYANIGKGPALNFRCWIEDPEHPEFRVKDRAICRTAIEVAISEEGYKERIATGIEEFKFGLGYIRAQYESIFGLTYESSLHFSENAAPELKYGEAKKDDIVIL